MAAFPPIGGRGGTGDLFALGPPVNTFNGADRTAAETARDAYDVANPGWLPQYDADEEIGIYLTFTSGGEPTVVSQVRIGGAWRDVQTVVGVRGQPGSGTDFGVITLNHIPAIGALGVPFDSGLSVDASGNFIVRRKLEIPSASLRFDELVELSEGSGDLLVNNRLSGDVAEVISIQSQNSQVSGRPTAFRHTEAENDFVIQGDDSATITVNPFSFQYTTTLDAQTNALRIRTGAAMNNARLRIVDNATGIAIKHLPDKAAWDEGVGGVNLRLGENTINFLSEAPDDPPNGIFNAGITPFRFRTGRVLDIEIRADTMSILGITSPGNFPYLVAQLQRSTVDELAMLSDVQKIQSHIHNFAVPTLPTRIESDQNLISTYVASYEITNHNLLTDLELRIVGDGNTVTKTVALPTAEGSNTFNITITSGDWTTLTQGSPTAITFQLVGTDEGGNTVPSNIIVVAINDLDADDFYYHGRSPSNNPGTIDVATIGNTEVQPGQHVFQFSIGPANENDFVILLYPNSKPVTSIQNTQSQNEVIQEFILSEDVRQLNSVDYSARVLGPLVNGFTATYQVTAG